MDFALNILIYMQMSFLEVNAMDLFFSTKILFSQLSGITLHHFILCICLILSLKCKLMMQFSS